MNCPICDRALSGPRCFASGDLGHGYELHCLEPRAYYRYTIDGIWYRMAFYEHYVDLWTSDIGGFSLSKRERLPLESIEFDPKHPEPLIEKMRILRAYQ